MCTVYKAHDNKNNTHIYIIVYTYICIQNISSSLYNSVECLKYISNKIYQKCYNFLVCNIFYSVFFNLKKCSMFGFMFGFKWFIMT